MNYSSTVYNSIHIVTIIIITIIYLIIISYFFTSATLLNRTTLLLDLAVPESSLSVPEVILGFLIGT